MSALKVDGETVALPANEVVEVIRPRAAQTRVPNGSPSLLWLVKFAQRGVASCVAGTADG